jgi:hypothetical protein
MVKDRVGTDALWEPMQAAGDITPWILAGNACGPDQRDYAPELELGGTVAYWAAPTHTKAPKGSPCKKKQPFDNFAVAAPNEAAAHLLTREGESRLTPADLALMVLADAKAARAATTVTIDPNNREARDVVRECVALADLGEWFSHKLRAATALAVFQGSQSAPWLAAAKSETREEQQAWTQLAQDTAYIAPFDERMRMHHIGVPMFHWSKLLTAVAEDTQALDEVVRDVRAGGAPAMTGPLPTPKQWFATPRSPGPGLKELKIVPPNPRAATWNVTAVLEAPAPPGSVVRILHRRFKSDGGDWAGVVTTGSDTTWTASITGTGDGGGMFAVEVVGGPGQAWRYPDVIKETPYKVLAP